MLPSELNVQLRHFGDVRQLPRNQCVDDCVRVHCGTHYSQRGGYRLDNSLSGRHVGELLAQIGA
jgi:hypothetical protein